MSVVIALRDIADAIESQSDEGAAYLNPETGEIVQVSEDEIALVEEGAGDEDLPQWERDAMPKVRERWRATAFCCCQTAFKSMSGPSWSASRWSRTSVPARCCSARSTAPVLFATFAAPSNGSDCWMPGIAIVRKQFNK